MPSVMEMILKPQVYSLPPGKTLDTMIKELIRYFYGRIQLNLYHTKVDEQIALPSNKHKIC
jgi:hypothetical protein